MNNIAHILSRIRCATLAVALGGLLAGGTHAAPSLAASFSLNDPAATATAARSMHALSAGERVRLQAVPLGASATQRTVDLELQRVDVFAPGARVRLHAPDGQIELRTPRTTAYLRGSVVGRPDARAMFAVEADGRLRALINLDGQVIAHDDTRELSMASALRIDGARTSPGVKPFRCGNTRQHAPSFAGRINPDSLSAALQGSEGTPMDALPATVSAASAGPLRTATLMIETDYELFQRLGYSASTVERYIADLTAYIGGIYQNELNVALTIGEINIYTSSGNNRWTAQWADDALEQLRGYWATNRSGTLRTAVMLLSGKSLSGTSDWVSGLAYVDAMCDDGYGYGVVGGIGFGYGGSFNPASPAMVWDSLGYAHELGHVFSSFHTHEFERTPGQNQPVDCCARSNYGGLCANVSPTLPGRGSLYGGSPGIRAGTIMSYCHHLTGSYGNMAESFGESVVYGVNAERVPAYMRSRIEDTAAWAPQCLPASSAPPATYSLSVDFQGSGAGAVFSSPAGLSCSGDCSASFSGGTQVTLAAMPATGSRFAGWGGDCSGTGQCLLTLGANRSVSARFEREAPDSARLACFFDWAEGGYPAYFHPAGGSARLDDASWFIRYYATQDAYLGVEKGGARLYYLGPESGGQLFDMGRVNDWLLLSGC